jgi:hypothetical protein
VLARDVSSVVMAVVTLVERADTQLAATGRLGSVLTTTVLLPEMTTEEPDALTRKLATAVLLTRMELAVDMLAVLFPEIVTAPDTVVLPLMSHDSAFFCETVQIVAEEAGATVAVLFPLICTRKLAAAVLLTRRLLAVDKIAVLLPDMVTAPDTVVLPLINHDSAFFWLTVKMVAEDAGATVAVVLPEIGKVAPVPGCTGRACPRFTTPITLVAVEVSHITTLPSMVTALVPSWY